MSSNKTPFGELKAMAKVIYPKPRRAPRAPDLVERPRSFSRNFMAVVTEGEDFVPARWSFHYDGKSSIVISCADAETPSGRVVFDLVISKYITWARWEKDVGSILLAMDQSRELYEGKIPWFDVSERFYRISKFEGQMVIGLSAPLTVEIWECSMHYGRTKLLGSVRFRSSAELNQFFLFMRDIHAGQKIPHFSKAVAQRSIQFRVGHKVRLG